MPTPRSRVQLRTERYEHGNPVNFGIGTFAPLTFWIRKDYELKLVQLMVKRASDRRQWQECECYPVVTFTHDGEMYRNGGLPVGWGLKLVVGNRIKEVA